MWQQSACHRFDSVQCMNFWHGLNITARTTRGANKLSDNSVRIWFLEHIRFKMTPENWQWWRRNNVIRQLVPDPSDRILEHPATDRRQSEGLYYTRLVFADCRARRRGRLFTRTMRCREGTACAVVGLFRAMSDSLTTSRCAIVVLCPTFIAGYNERWFHLENLITDIDVIYVLYGGLDKATVTQNTMLGAEIKASIRNSCCLTWSWPLEDAKQRRQEKVNISKFFCHLKLAIPQRRRRTTAAGVVESGRPRIESTESCDSATDVHRRLLPTTASHHPVHANIVWYFTCSFADNYTEVNAN